MSTNMTGYRRTNYFYSGGTSMAAPVVSGISALILEKWKTEVVPGANLHTQGPWNSTVKAILVHTATDLIKDQPDEPELREGVTGANPDLCSPHNWSCTRESVSNSIVKYFKGPDYATGYGLVNAGKALDYTDSNRVIQDSIVDAASREFTMEVPGRLNRLRFTLAWDDLPGSLSSAINTSKLVNDLNIRVVDPNGDSHFPWILDPLPQVIDSNQPPANGIDPIYAEDVKPARKSINFADNLEVVDVDPAGGGYLPSGQWRIIVSAYRVASGHKQDFSVVADYKIIPIP